VFSVEEVAITLQGNVDEVPVYFEMPFSYNN
jgi:hypothetical protein